MPDLYMPDVQVEVAFNAGYTTPAASRTWTDVSDYVELADDIDIGFGRRDERSTADANTLQLTLDNSDGRFTAGRAASPYYPNVKVGRPIRVRVTPNANLHPNGGLEVNATNWYSNTVFGSYGTATMARSTVRAHEGSAALLVTWPTHATASYACANLPPTIMRAGETYTASCWVWVPTGSPDPRIDTIFSGAGARTSLKNQWVFLTYTFVAGSVNVTAGVQVATPTAGQFCFVDEFMVNRGATALPYDPQVAETSTRFVGFVDEWPVEWDGSDRYAKAPIRAASRISRLGLSTKLRSMPEQAILAYRPAGYWTLGDPSGSSTASDTAGRGSGPLVVTEQPPGPSAPVVFGNATGPGTDGLTAAEFANGSFLSIATLPAGTGRAFHVNFATSTGNASLMRIGNLNLRITSGGTLTADLGGVGGGSSLTGGIVTDGRTHDVIFAFTFGGTASLYLDGVLKDTGTPTVVPSATELNVGIGFVGTLAHVAYFDSSSATIDAAAAATISGVILNGAPETTDLRLTRLVGWAGVPASEVTAETGVEVMAVQQTDGTSVVDAVRECEETEGGVLFDGRDGNVTFHNRSHRYTRPAAATLDMASQHVGSDYVPRVDRSALVNDVTMENGATGEKVRAVNQGSADEYGIATATVTSFAASSAGFGERADWVLASYAEPRTRVPSLTVDVLAHQGLTPSAQTLLGVTIGDLLAVSNAPSQSDTTTPSYFVEGYSEVIGAESYELTFNLSPSSPTADTLLLDSATRGLLDTNLLAL